MSSFPVSNNGCLSEFSQGEVLAQGWQFCESQPGTWSEPPDVERAMNGATTGGWMPMDVPGTVAKALHLGGQYDLHQPRSLHDSDFWCRTVISGDGQHLLQCDGLATLAEIYLDGKLLGESCSMFLPAAFALTLSGEHVLYIAFRSLNNHLASLKLPRARWRVAMVSDQSLRGVRTTLLGHMPSWCPAVHMVGPWRSLRLISADSIISCRLYAQAVADGGRLWVEVVCVSDMEGCSISCAGVSALLPHAVNQTYCVELTITDVQRWWPIGMGQQVLYDVALNHPQGAVVLGKVGFRSIELNTGEDGCGFQLVVNGKTMFARGAVYTPPDMLHPGSEAGVEKRLQLLADMGANLLRVAGPFCYESTAFFRCCDRLGILVWQDLMLANFDYPFVDDAFTKTVQGEVEVLLKRIAGSPSLAVLCGGSEIHQQAAMLGLTQQRRHMAFFSDQLPQMCAQFAPQLIVVSNSPSGGELPFSVREGVSHYFGVGAYERPLEDARRAAPRFITECLAFANVPEPISLESFAVPAVHHPNWKAGVPRDRSASWDFEDTRDHYLERVFALPPGQLRRTDPAHYLDASRALGAHIMATTLAEWRRPASPTCGALVFTAADLQPGAGWGLIDSSGEPKAAYYGFRQVCKPLALFLTDEGCDGLDIHLLNDTPKAYCLQLEVRALRQGTVTVARGELVVNLPAYGALTVPATRVVGAFFDLTYAYRFGKPNHDTVVVQAKELGISTSPVSLDACYFPLGAYVAPSSIGLQAGLTNEGGVWCLELSTSAVARFVHIDDRLYRPQDNYFHLPPGSKRTVSLLARSDQNREPPQGTVSALNSLDTVSYRGAT